MFMAERASIRSNNGFIADVGRVPRFLHGEMLGKLVAEPGGGGGGPRIIRDHKRHKVPGRPEIGELTRSGEYKKGGWLPHMSRRDYRISVSR